MMGNDRNEMIRARAYEIWEEEGRPAGRESEHWRQAEMELDEAAAENATPHGETVVRRGGSAGEEPENSTVAPLKRGRRRKE